MAKGRLIVVSGPSGVGKGTVLRELFRRRRDLRFSISATTRGPREDERNGVDYFFMTRGRYEELIDQGAFLEYAQVHGNYYGTLRAQVEETVGAGRDIILDIDVQGGLQVFGSGMDCLSLFVLPPSIGELRRRLASRASESPEAVALRTRNAREEIAAAVRYRYAVVNRHVEACADDFEAILDGESRDDAKACARFRTEAMRGVIERLKEEALC